MVSLREHIETIGRINGYRIYPVKTGFSVEFLLFREKDTIHHGVHVWKLQDMYCMKSGSFRERRGATETECMLTFSNSEKIQNADVIMCKDPEEFLYVLATELRK